MYVYGKDQATHDFKFKNFTQTAIKKIQCNYIGKFSITQNVELQQPTTENGIAFDAFRQREIISHVTVTHCYTVTLLHTSSMFYNL